MFLHLLTALLWLLSFDSFALYDKKILNPTCGYFGFKTEYTFHSNIYLDYLFSSEQDSRFPAILFYEQNISLENIDCFLFHQRKNPSKYGLYDQLTVNQSNDVILSGNVNFVFDDKNIFANSALVINAKERDKSLFNFQGNVVLKDDSSKMNATFLIFNNNTSEFSAQNLHLITNEYGFSFFGEEGYGNDDIKIIQNAVLTSCLSYDDKIQSNIFQCYQNNSKEISKDIDKQYKKMPFSIFTKELKFDQKNDKATLRNLTFRIRNIPIFKLPYISFPTSLKRNGQSGLLPIMPIIKGRRQQGLEIPYYLRFGSNKDLLISTSLYESLPLISTNTNNERNDYRMRENNIAFQWRHLVNHVFGKNSFYTIDSSVTDRTKLIGDNGIFEKSNNGDYIFGHRWHLDFNSSFWLSKTTNIRLNYFDVSDMSYLYVYQMRYKQYAQNEIAISDVRDDSFNELSFVQYKPVMMYFDESTTPKILTLNSYFDKYYKNIPGVFTLHTNLSNMEREAGYSRNRGVVNLGYKFTDVLKYGNRVTMNADVRNDFYSTRYNNYNTNPISPFSITNNSTNLINLQNASEYIFGNYGYFMNSDLYSGGLGAGGDFRRTFGSFAIQTDYPLIFETEKNQFIIEPKIALRHKSGDVGFSNMTNEMGGLAMSNYMFYDNLINGYDVLDFGTYSLLGLDAHYKTDQYEISLEMGKANYLIHDDQYMSGVPYYGMFKNRVADYITNISFKHQNGISISSLARIDSDTNQLIQNSTNLMYTNPVTKSSVYINYMNVAQDVSIANREIQAAMIGFTRRFFDVYDVDINSSFNLSDEPSLYFPDGKTGSMRHSLRIMKDLGCVSYGLSLSQNNLNMAGMPSYVLIRFLFTINTI